jgi:hypothetical protein
MRDDIVQVQPDNNVVRTQTKAMRTEGKGLQGLTRRERIRASRLPVFLTVNAGHGPGARNNLNALESIRCSDFVTKPKHTTGAIGHCDKLAK